MAKRKSRISHRGLPFIVIAREVDGYTVKWLKEKQQELKNRYPNHSILLLRCDYRSVIKRYMLIYSENAHPFSIHIK